MTLNADLYLAATKKTWLNLILPPGISRTKNTGDDWGATYADAEVKKKGNDIDHPNKYYYKLDFVPI